MDLTKLKDPFPESDIEWRVGRAGENANGMWAMCLAYITNRAIMERLDEVCGAGNWRNEYAPAPTGGVLCGLSIRVGDEWVTKWDGAENTEIESIKGGLSGSMKRAGVQWGIGRYLYNLTEGFANVHPSGSLYGKLPEKDGGASFKWDPPALPAWALPGGSGEPSGTPKAPTPPRAPEVPLVASEFLPDDGGEPHRGAGTQNIETPGQCPDCGNKLWDNREKKASGAFNPKSPDFACRDKECGWATWL